MMQKINENQTMITLQIRPYVKVVILQVTDFISFVVDEQNFAKTVSLWKLRCDRQEGPA